MNIDKAAFEKPHQVHWWGTECTCKPVLIDAVLGDGKVFLALQPLTTRPQYYGIRIDSSWHLEQCSKCENECPDELFEHLDEIYEAIEEQCGDVETARSANQDPDAEPESTDWPMFDLDCGSTWWVIDETRYLVK